jgi:hypothetical protein
MTAELLDKEVIEGKRVQEIIKEFEIEHGKVSRLAHIKQENSDEEEKDQA